MYNIRTLKEGVNFKVEAYSGKRRVGLMQGFMRDNDAIVVMTEVDEAHRRKGLNTRMLLELLKKFKPNGLKIILTKDSILENWVKKQGFNITKRDESGSIAYHKNSKELLKKLEMRLKL